MKKKRRKETREIRRKRRKRRTWGWKLKTSIHQKHLSPLSIIFSSSSFFSSFSLSFLFRWERRERERERERKREKRKREKKKKAPFTHWRRSNSICFSSFSLQKREEERKWQLNHLESVYQVFYHTFTLMLSYRQKRKREKEKGK